MNYSEKWFFHQYEKCHRSIHLFDNLHRMIWVFVYLLNGFLFALTRKLGIVISEDVLVVVLFALMPLTFLEIYLIEKYMIKRDYEKFLLKVDMTKEEADRHYELLKKYGIMPEGIRRGENIAPQIEGTKSLDGEPIQPLEESEKNVDLKLK